MQVLSELLWIDYVIIGAIALSTLISLFRGFVKEVFSLLAWILAFWSAVRFGPLASEQFTMISTPSARLGLGYLSVFLVVLIAGALFSHFMTLLVKQTQLQGTDRSLGLFFGAGRGVLIVTVLVMAAKLTPLDQDPWWKESVLIVHFERIAAWVQGQMPPEIAQKFEQVEEGVEALPPAAL